MFFSRRPRTGRDRFLAVKLATLVAGGIVGLVGMRLDSSLLVSLAMGVVLVGFLLRFAREPGSGDRDPGARTETPEPRVPDPGPR